MNTGTYVDKVDGVSDFGFDCVELFDKSVGVLADFFEIVFVVF